MSPPNLAALGLQCYSSAPGAAQSRLLPAASGLGLGLPLTWGSRGAPPAFSVLAERPVRGRAWIATLPAGGGTEAWEGGLGACAGEGQVESGLWLMAHPSPYFSVAQRHPVKMNNSTDQSQPAFCRRPRWPAKQRNRVETSRASPSTACEEFPGGSGNLRTLQTPSRVAGGLPGHHPVPDAHCLPSSALNCPRSGDFAPLVCGSSKHSSCLAAAHGTASGKPAGKHRAAPQAD